MLQTIQRFVFVALLLSLAPPNRAQEFAPRSETPQLTEARRLLQDNSDPPFSPEDLGCYTPWAESATVFRYQHAAVATWGPNPWLQDSEKVWQVLESIAGPIRADPNRVSEVLLFFQNWIPEMPDSEMQSLAEHLEFLAQGLPEESTLWIELQSWALSILTDFQLWRKAIPTLLKIEQVLSNEDAKGGDGIKSFYVHLDCSGSYASLGIRERAMEHLTKAQACIHREPNHRNAPYWLGHLLQQQILHVRLFGTPEDLISIIEESRHSINFGLMERVTQAEIEFSYVHALYKLNEASLSELEQAFDTVMEATDPSLPNWQEADEGTRSAAQAHLSRAYIYASEFGKALDLHESSGFMARSRRDFANYRGAAPGTGSLNPDLSFLIPHYLWALDDSPIPVELQGWINTAYELRLKELSSSALLPLGIGGSAHQASNALTECRIRLLLQTNPGPDGIEQALQALITSELVGTLARHLGADEATPRRVQERLLSPGSGIYQFHTGTQYSHAFLIDQNWIRVHRLGFAADFMKLSNRLKKELLRAQLQGRNIKALERSISDLQQFLLPPELANELQASNWANIAFSGFEGASYVPMELMSPMGVERLGDLMPVSYLPSLAAALALEKRRSERPPGPEGSWLSLIDTSAPAAMLPASQARLIKRGTKLQALPFTAKDQLALFGSLPDNFPNNLKIGEAASVEDLWSANAHEVSALFVMSHGTRDDDLAASPGLLLRSKAGGTTVVGPSDLDHFSAPPFVMLIACGTTDGAERFGDDGIQHLAGSLMKQGSDSILSAHLPLLYEDSKLLAAEVIRGLTNDGLSPAESLWQARLNIKDQASFPGRYLLHARGLANHALLPAIPPAKRSGSSWPWILTGILGLLAATLISRSRSSLHQS